MAAWTRVADIERYVQSGGGKIAPGTAPKAGDSGNPFTAWMTVIHRVDDSHSWRGWWSFAPWMEHGATQGRWLRAMASASR